jgi:acyl-CoA thioester hydrolase
VFQQRILVVATLEEYENRLKISYVITEVGTGERVTKGYTIQVAVENESTELCFVSPPVLIEKIHAASS